MNAERHIMEHFFHYDIVDLRRRYKNPFRKDSSAGCYFRWYNQRFLFFDNACVEASFDCFSLVMRQYSCNFNECLYIIAKAFNIDIDYAFNKIEIVESANEYNIDTESIEIKRNVALELKKRKEFDIDLRPWSYSDKNYWYGKYGITRDTLKKYNVFPVKIAKKSISSSKFQKIFDSTIDDDLCYAYIFENNVDDIEFTSLKVYRPFNKDMKWYSNTSSYDVFGYSSLPKRGEKLVIASSAKDAMVLYEMGYNAIAFQTEALIPPLIIMNELKDRFDEIYFLYDLDIAGLKYSIKYSEKYKCKARFLLKINNKDKDVSEYRELLGFDKLYGILKSILT